MILYIVMYYCLVCGSSFTSVPALDVHIEQAHDKHTCRVCPGHNEDEDDCERIDGLESTAPT